MSKNGPYSSSNVARAGNRSGLDLHPPLGTRLSTRTPCPLIGPLMPKCPTTQDILGTENHYSGREEPRYFEMKRPVRCAPTHVFPQTHKLRRALDLTRPQNVPVLDLGWVPYSM